MPLTEPLNKLAARSFNQISYQPVSPAAMNRLTPLIKQISAVCTRKMTENLDREIFPSVFCYQGNDVIFPLWKFIRTIVLHFGNYDKHPIINKSILITACIYLDRYFLIKGQDFLNPSNIHLLLLMSIMQAHKYLVDGPCNNASFATIIRLPIQEFNEIEVAFLRALKVDVSVTKESYEAYQTLLFSPNPEEMKIHVEGRNQRSYLFPPLEFTQEVSSPIPDSLEMDLESDISSEESSSDESDSIITASPEDAAVSLPLKVSSAPMHCKTPPPSDSHQHITRLLKRSATFSTPPKIYLTATLLQELPVDVKDSSCMHLDAFDSEKKVSEKSTLQLSKAKIGDLKRSEACLSISSLRFEVPEPTSQSLTYRY